jgi:DNA-binding transcriptional regulator YhcF (GntR family)
MTAIHFGKWFRERELLIPVHDQSRWQISDAIFYGELESGIQFPCIRKIASFFKVYMMVVYNVYCEMVCDCLFASRPRVGYSLVQPISSKEAFTAVIFKGINAGLSIIASGRLCF